MTGTPQDRAKGAILGAFVGEALGVGPLALRSEGTATLPRQLD